VADHPDGLAVLEEPLRERDRRRIHADEVGVADAARQHERVESGCVSLGHREVGLLHVALLALDRLRLGRHERGRSARVEHGLPGREQLAVLEAVGREEGDRLAGDVVGHRGCPLVRDRRDQRRCAPR